MPLGFFTVEQFKATQDGAEPTWVTISHHDGCDTLTQVMEKMESTVEPGFYRVIQTQRMIRAEKVDGKIKLHKRHAMNEATLNRSANANYQDDKAASE